MKSKDIVYSSISMAIVFLSTMIGFTIFGQWINGSDFSIILLSLIFGWKIGVISSFGAMLADLFLGFAVFIPATLIAKSTIAYVFGKFKFNIFLTIFAGLVSLLSYFITNLLIDPSLAYISIPFNLFQYLIGLILTLYIFKSKIIIKIKK